MYTRTLQERIFPFFGKVFLWRFQLKIPWASFRSARMMYKSWRVMISSHACCISPLEELYQRSSGALYEARDTEVFFFCVLFEARWWKRDGSRASLQQWATGTFDAKNYWNVETFGHHLATASTNWHDKDPWISHDLRCFYTYLNWCRISSINRIGQSTGVQFQIWSPSFIINFSIWVTQV